MEIANHMKIWFGKEPFICEKCMERMVAPKLYDGKRVTIIEHGCDGEKNYDYFYPVLNLYFNIEKNIITREMASALIG